jgi:hypothetical protein
MPQDREFAYGIGGPAPHQAKTSAILTLALSIWIAMVSTPAFAGNFSERALKLNAVYADAKPFSAMSPDGKSKVTVSVRHADADVFDVEVSGEIGNGRFSMVSGPNAELLWSPDSRYLFITLNDGGAIGRYLLRVIGQFGGLLEVKDLTALVTREFGRPVKCFEPEDPNVAGVTWLEQPGHMVAIAQVLPHSNCDAMGTFKAYEIAVETMQVVRQYSQQEAKGMFKAALGPELRNAQDCETSPADCYIPMLHPASKQP